MESYLEYGAPGGGKMKARTRIPAALFILAVLLCESASADLPKTGSGVPVFPGAYRAGRSKDMDIPPGSSVFQTRVPIEEVCTFYLQFFGFVPGEIYENQAICDNPSASPERRNYVACTMRFHDFRDDGSSGSVQRLGKDKQMTLSKGRKPYKPERWLEWVGFVWTVNGDSPGQETVLYLLVRDESLSADWKAYKPQTGIYITRIDQL